MLSAGNIEIGSSMCELKYAFLEYYWMVFAYLQHQPSYYIQCIYIWKSTPLFDDAHHNWCLFCLPCCCCFSFRATPSRYVKHQSRDIVYRLAIVTKSEQSLGNWVLQHTHNLCLSYFKVVFRSYNKQIIWWEIDKFIRSLA